MLINGAVVGTGRGSDVLGHPFEALAWLANQLAGQGRAEGRRPGADRQRRQTNWVAAGDRVAMDLGRLGAVELSFG